MLKSGVKTRVRIGRISYVNCIPFYHRLSLAEDIIPEYHAAHPAKLNLAMRLGKIDIAPISSLEYLNHQREYLLLPSLCIGSRDFSGSVLLFSKERIEGLHDVTISLTRQSLSSAALVRILLKYKYKFKNRFAISSLGPDQMLQKNQAALVIGDDALFHRPKEFVYKYDLSELWWNWTEKPFCFSVWAVRREFAGRHPEVVAAIIKKFIRNLEGNLADIETLIRDAMGMNFLDVHFSKVFGYLFNLHYRLDPPMREGLELFYRLAARAGLSPHPKPLEFFKLS
jgi:chorismate dehydratase